MRRFGALAAQLSLRVRLTLLSSLGAALVLPLVVFVLHGAVIDALDDAVTAELRVRAEDVTAELRAGVDPVETDGLLVQLLDEGGRTASGGTDPLLRPGDLPSGTGETVIRDRPVASVGSHARVLAQRVPYDGGGGWVLVAGSTAPVDRVQRRLAVLEWVAGPLLVLVVGLTAWVLTRSALQPVRRITRRAATLSLEQPEERLPQPPGRDEIAELGATLNAMLDRIAATVAHERAFVDDASHELRTPIAVLRGELELARLELADRDGADHTLAALDSALEETDRLARITEHLLVLARSDAGRLADNHERVAVMPVVAHVIDRIDRSGVQLQVSGVEAHVFATPDLVDHVVTNLVANAVRFAARLVRVSLSVVDHSVVLQVDDDGPGFGADLLGRALDRFARGEPSRSRAGGGAGLGLAIVAAIVDELDGTIELANGGALGGASVRVRLPLAPALG